MAGESYTMFFGKDKGLDNSYLPSVNILKKARSFDDDESTEFMGNLLKRLRDDGYKKFLSREHKAEDPSEQSKVKKRINDFKKRLEIIEESVGNKLENQEGKGLASSIKRLLGPYGIPDPNKIKNLP